MSGKGSGRRPAQISAAELEANWAATFGPKPTAPEAPQATIPPDPTTDPAPPRSPV